MRVERVGRKPREIATRRALHQTKTCEGKGARVFSSISMSVTLQARNARARAATNNKAIIFDVGTILLIDEFGVDGSELVHRRGGIVIELGCVAAARLRARYLRMRSAPEGALPVLGRPLALVWRGEGYLVSPFPSRGYLASHFSSQPAVLFWRRIWLRAFGGGRRSGSWAVMSYFDECLAP